MEHFSTFQILVAEKVRNERKSKNQKDQKIGMPEGLVIKYQIAQPQSINWNELIKSNRASCRVLRISFLNSIVYNVLQIIFMRTECTKIKSAIDHSGTVRSPSYRSSGYIF